MVKKILTIGSLNMDLVIQTDRIPATGETISGIGFKTVCGGKGGNQAYAVGRLGGASYMMGCVGKDGFGEDLIASLEQAHVDCSKVLHLEGEESGIAAITVCNGDNSIIIIPGANGMVNVDYIRQNEVFICQADLILLQLEIPLETVEYIVRLASEHKIPVMLNPAPAKALPEELFAQLYGVIVNETECEFYTGQKIKSVHDAKAGLQKLLDKGIRQCIVTLGEMGCVYNMDKTICYEPAIKVNAVDSTAAGDTFTAAVAVSLMEGKDIREAVKFATKASSITVTKVGAQTSIPTREEIEQL